MRGAEVARPPATDDAWHLERIIARVRAVQGPYWLVKRLTARSWPPYTAGVTVTREDADELPVDRS